MNSYKTIKILILFNLFVLSGCANNAYLIKDLTPLDSDNYILIDHEITYEESRGIGVLWKEGLKPGKYKPELANEIGTFYRGPEGCVIQYMGGGSMGPFEGGIWIPKDKINNSPRLYYYFNYNKGNAQLAGGPIVMAILESGKGDITFMPPISNKDFLKNIQITNI